MKEIYFHVGLGKTGSTFLQKKVFPLLRGINYIPTNKYHKVSSIINRTRYSRILVSREFDIQLEREVRKFVAEFPQTRIIICFRRHDDWLVSQYKRHVKNGFTGEIEDFLDLKSDRGYWKQEEFYFSKKLELIKSLTNHPPLVLYYDELKSDPISFIQRITEYTRSDIDINRVSTGKVHKSFSDKQLLVLRSFCRKWIPNTPKGSSNKLIHWLTFRPFWALYHLVMFFAKGFSDKWIPKEPLIKKEYLEKVERYYYKDWEKTRSNASL